MVMGENDVKKADREIQMTKLILLWIFYDPAPPSPAPGIYG